MNRVVLVSNRVLDPAAAAQAGGVAVALADVLREHDGLWFGWNGRTVGEEADLPPEAEVQKHEGMVTVTSPLLQSEYDGYYLGYANSVLWPVFHNRLDLARIGGGYYSSYMQVNRRLAHALKPLLRPDDTIWVHDYHFLPFAAELRGLGVRSSPFPSTWSWRRRWRPMTSSACRRAPMSPTCCRSCSSRCTGRSFPTDASAPSTR